mgnify:CR=1 FL=1
MQQLSFQLLCGDTQRLALALDDPDFALRKRLFRFDNGNVLRARKEFLRCFGLTSLQELPGVDMLATMEQVKIDNEQLSISGE